MKQPPLTSPQNSMSMTNVLGMNGGKGTPLIKTNTVDTGNNSLTQRLAILTDTYNGQAVTFYCVEGELTEAVTLNDNHSLHFAAQTFTNSVSVAIPPPITVGDNAVVTQEPGAIIYESNVSTKTALIWTKDGAQNVLIDGIYFKGHAGNADPAGLAGVWLLNAKNSIVRNCTFDNVHNYNTVIGKYPATPGYSDGCIIANNTYLGFKTQNIALTDGRNCQIINNTLDYTGDLSSGPYFIPIDIEPNYGDEVISNLLINGNTIDTRGVQAYYTGIAVQGDILLGGMSNVTVSNNTITTKVDEATYSNCQVGIKVSGVNVPVITGNYMEGAYYTGLVVNSGASGNISTNTLYNNYGGIALNGVSASNVDDNILTVTAIPNPGQASIIEGEFQLSVTSAGAVITCDPGDIAGSYWKFNADQIGLPVVFNGNTYTIQSVDVSAYPTKATMTVSVGTVASKTFTPSDVTIATGNIAITGHGLNTGAAVQTKTDGTLPVNAGLVADGVAYVIKVDANNIKLATSLANAMAGTAMTYSSAGSGTSTLYPIMLTQFSSNTYSGNTAVDGIHLNPNGTSVII